MCRCLIDRLGVCHCDVERALGDNSPKFGARPSERWSYGADELESVELPGADVVVDV